jgi:hypothetical protein
MEHRNVIVVVGHHRGGTSAAAGGLVAMGFYPGPEENLMPPSDDNPRGYFEFLPLVAQHDRLLLALDRSWFDNRPLPDGWTKGIPFAQSRKSVAAYLRKLSDEADGRPVVVKDPRVARLFPLYVAAATEAEVRLRWIVVDRAWDAVEASLMKRDGWDHVRAHEFVAAQAEHLEEWRAGASSITFPNFTEAGGRDLIDAAHRLAPGRLIYNHRTVAAAFDERLVHHG